MIGVIVSLNCNNGNTRLESDPVDAVRQHHQVHQPVGRLDVPLAVRLLGVAPLISRVDSVAGLECGGQHWETVQPVGQSVHCGHEGGPEDVDLSEREQLLVVSCQVDF